MCRVALSGAGRPRPWPGGRVQWLKGGSLKNAAKTRSVLPSIDIERAQPPGRDGAEFLTTWRTGQLSDVLSLADGSPAALHWCAISPLSDQGSTRPGDDAERTRLAEARRALCRLARFWLGRLSRGRPSRGRLNWLAADKTRDWAERSRYRADLPGLLFWTKPARRRRVQASGACVRGRLSLGLIFRCSLVRFCGIGPQFNRA